jgi:hypothetical protein
MRSTRSTLLRRFVGRASVGIALALTAVSVAGLVAALSLVGGSVPENAPTWTATTPGIVTVTVAPSPERAIDEILGDLDLANIAFNAPTELRLHEPVVIQLLLSGNRPIEELKEELSALGEREGAQIRASDSMEATLTGTGFAIEPVTPSVQLVSDEAVTEWKWEVEPTRAGVRRLHLTLSALIDVAGRERPYTVRTFERTLDVRVSLGDRVAGFIGDNWQWLWTTLLIPVGGWALQRRRREASTGGPAPSGAGARLRPRRAGRAGSRRRRRGRGR